MAVNQAREVGMGIAMLVEAFRVSRDAMTDARIRLLQHALAKIPPQLIEPAIMHTIDTRTSKCKDWLPSNAELLEDAEHVRRVLLKAHSWDGCVECENQAGWVEIEVDGVKRVTRCGCVRRHQAKLASLGVTSEPLALPAAVGERGGEE